MATRQTSPSGAFPERSQWPDSHSVHTIKGSRWSEDHAQRRSELGLRALSIDIRARQVALVIAVVFIGLGMAISVSILQQSHIAGAGFLATGVGLIRQLANPASPANLNVSRNMSPTRQI